MKKAFDKLGKAYCFVWAAILFDLIGSVVFGYLHKSNKIITLLSRSDIYGMIGKYIGDNGILSFITKYAGSGIAVITILYILILLLYIFLAFGIPTIMYSINKAFVQNQTSSASNFTTWILSFIAFLPGIWFVVKLVLLFSMLVSVDIFLLHLLILFVLQAALIIAYIIMMFVTAISKGEKE